jgi:hypothetical protein
MIEKPFELRLKTTPTLIYIQSDNVGIGKLYLNGKQIHGLQEIEIKSESKTGTCFPELKLKIVPNKLTEFGTSVENNTEKETVICGCHYPAFKGIPEERIIPQDELPEWMQKGAIK